MKYTIVGISNFYRYATEEDAVSAAQQKSMDGQVWFISEEGQGVICIAFEGRLYYP
jgi:hypothetical protein